MRALVIKFVVVFIIVIFPIKLFAQVYNVAVNKAASASSIDGTNIAANAIDADEITTWKSAASDPQWITIDLQSTYYISGIEILWGNSSAAEYTIDVSYDGTTWTTISTLTGLTGVTRTDNINGIDRYARYVKMHGTVRNTGQGYSIQEFRVLGQSIACSEEMVNNDFNWSIRSNNVSGNPEITFIPARAGIAETNLDGKTTPIEFYFGEDPALIDDWVANDLNPNQPFEITWPTGMDPNQPLYFYFTYSVDDSPVFQKNSKGNLGVITQYSCDCNDFYSVYSDRTAITEGLTLGVDGEWYLWEGTFIPLPEEDPYEGSHVLAIEQQDKETWAGAAIHYKPGSDDPRLDLSRFASGSYNFAVKIPEGSKHSFYVFLRDDLGGEATEGKISFEPTNDPPGVLRDGLWHNVSIPVSDLITSGLNLSRMDQLFGVLCLTKLTGQRYYFDDVYFACSENHIKSFSGNIGSNWIHPENWKPQGVPFSDDIVTVGSGIQVDVLNNVSVFDVRLLPGSKLTVQSGGSINVNSHLHIESSGLGTGSLIDMGGIVLGQSAVFRKYLDKSVASGWTVSSPVADAGSDIFLSSEAVFYFDPQAAQWSAYTTGSMQAMRGYWTRFTNDHALRFASSGFNTGIYSFTEFYRTGYNSGNSGWNFIGNPYPSAINWDAVFTLNGGPDFVVQTKLNAAIYVSDHLGGYKSYVNGVGTNGFDGSIPAATAFWVQVNKAHVYPETVVPDAVLTLDNSVRTHAGDDGSLKSAQAADQSIVRLYVKSDNKTDEAVLRIKADATLGYDPLFDAIKRFSNNKSIPQVAFRDIEGNDLSIYSMGNMPEQSVSVPLSLNCVLNAEHELFVEVAGDENINSLILEDTYANEMILLETGRSYLFNPEATEENQRFILHLVQGISTTVADTTVIQSDLLFYDNKIFIQDIEESGAVLEIFDVSGKMVLQKHALESFSVINQALPGGVYVVILRTKGNVSANKMLIK